jgi:hypothetical protein
MIPTSGIRGAGEQEARATSALLSVLGAVDEFGRTILRRRFGAPAGRIETFIEVPIKMRNGKPVRPDGAIRIRRGKKTWTALVEVKTGTSQLDPEQVEKYVDAAREHGFDAVVTISNQIMPATGDHPVKISGKKLQSVGLYHMSWVALLTEAVMEHVHRGVADPEQAWILGELIAYLEHPKSGVMQFEDMGPHWVKVRDGARAGTLLHNEEGVRDVVERWDEFSRYLCLRLGRDLKRDVRQVLSRRDRSDPAGHRSRLARALARDGILSCTLRVPGAAADINVQGDLRARTVSASLSVAAPKDRQPRARVNWFVRQLREAPDKVQVVTAFEARSATTSRPLPRLIENPNAALLEDRQVPPRNFTCTLTRDMRRDSSAKSFIGSVTKLLDEFYRSVAQDLKAWRPPAPRLPERPDASADAALEYEAPPTLA